MSLDMRKLCDNIRSRKSLSLTNQQKPTDEELKSKSYIQSKSQSFDDELGLLELTPSQLTPNRVARSFLENLYRRLHLTNSQKKDLHVMLIKLGDLRQLRTLEKWTYKEVKNRLCCRDRLCLCGSRALSTPTKEEKPYKGKAYYDKLYKALKLKCGVTLELFRKWDQKMEVWRSETNYFDDESELNLEEQMLTQRDMYSQYIKTLHLQLRTLT